MNQFSNNNISSSSWDHVTSGSVLGPRHSEEYVAGPSIVAMDKSRQQTQHQEAYFLFFVASLGIALNVLVVTMTFVRHNLRRMTSAFLVHGALLNLIKAAFCIPFGLNLLSSADETEDNQPPDCNLQGSAFIVMVTASAVNMVAMICTEAYTFGEVNVGGNSHGTSCCILFGLLVVYITSVILHLGPTLIGGDIVYNPDIGSCAFKLGSVTGYVANVMWIVIITFAFVGVGHFLKKLYKEIQSNRPNRVSMLVRHSITIVETEGRKPSACTVAEMTQEALHRAKIFVITAIAFALCWYPLFLLIVVDIQFKVSPKVYQAFNFIAWTQSMVEPIILIFFDRNLNLLARFMYCDREAYTATQIAYLMAQNRQRPANTSAASHGEMEELAGHTSVPMLSGASTSGAHHSHLGHNSIEMAPGECFPHLYEGGTLSSAGGGGAGGGGALLELTDSGMTSPSSTPHAFSPCRHFPEGAEPGETTPLRTGQATPLRSGQATPLRSGQAGKRSSGSSGQEQRSGRGDTSVFADDSFEMDFSPIRLDHDTSTSHRARRQDTGGRAEDDVAC